MPNFNILQGLMPQRQGVIAQTGGGGGSDDGGIGELFDGIKGLAGALGGGSSNQESVNVSSPVSNPNTYGSNAPIGGLQQPQQNQSLGQQPGIQSPQQQVMGSDPFKQAMARMGMQEGNPALTEYLRKANPNLDPRATPWCAGFVGSVLNASGQKGTGSLAAKSYLNYGQPVKSPSQGDIVVFNDMSGRNDPAHGHVGFVDHIKDGQVFTVGGNQGNAVSMKAYPISAVAGFRRPPTGQQVAQFAAQNKIQSPGQLASLTKPQPQQQVSQQAAQQQPGMAPPQIGMGNTISQRPIQSAENQMKNSSLIKDMGLTTKTIADFEEFIPHTYWDVNAYRTGYGSDTITTADGKVIPVKQGMTVSKEDATRDLNRRTQEFAQTAAKQTGPEVWENLPGPAQAALTSVAYNYGSLPKRILPAVKSGDINQIAEAVKSLRNDNKGINKHRRDQEAEMIRNSPIAPNTLNDGTGGVVRIPQNITPPVTKPIQAPVPNWTPNGQPRLADNAQNPYQDNYNIPQVSPEEYQQNQSDGPSAQMAQNGGINWSLLQALMNNQQRA